MNRLITAKNDPDIRRSVPTLVNFKAIPIKKTEDLDVRIALRPFHTDQMSTGTWNPDALTKPIVRRKSFVRSAAKNFKDRRSSNTI